MRLVLNVILIIIAATYLPLGVIATDVASRFWWQYSAAVLIVALLDFAVDIRNHMKDDRHA